MTSASHTVTSSSAVHHTDIQVTVSVDCSPQPSSAGRKTSSQTVPVATSTAEEVSCWMRYLCCCCKKKKPARTVTLPPPPSSVTVTTSTTIMNVYHPPVERTGRMDMNISHARSQSVVARIRANSLMTEDELIAAQKQRDEAGRKAAALREAGSNASARSPQSTRTSLHEVQASGMLHFDPSAEAGGSTATGGDDVVANGSSSQVITPPA